MDGSEYSGNHGYAYDPNMMYVQDPRMMHHPAYYNQGQQWMWQGQGYHHGPPAQFYGGYPQMPVNYGYGYDGTDGVMYNQQEYQGYEIPENSGRRSKHSYSQNRTRNRNKVDQRQSYPNSYITTSNTSNNNQHSESISEADGKDSFCEGAGTTNSSEGDLNSKPSENSKIRGRFHGADGRTKHYDKEKQQTDRQKTYNKDFKAEKTNHESLDKRKTNTSVEGSKDTGTGDSVEDKGAKPKSYHKDTRHKDNKENVNSGKERNKHLENRDNRYHKSEGQLNSNRPHGQTSLMNMDKNEDGTFKNKSDESGDSSSKESGGRKKKKDFQVY